MAKRNYDLDRVSGQFTKKGMRVAMTEELASGSTGQEQYFFDNLYELTRTIYPNGEDHAWTYDRIGNRMSSSVTDPPDPPLVSSYTYYSNGRGGNSQLLQSDGTNTYTWDANGNLLRKTGPSSESNYAWSSRNLLTAITSSSLQASYRYDFMSRRTGRTVGSIESSYQYATQALVRETTTGGATSEYVFGPDIDEILHARIDGADYFYATDALGSVRQLLDATGQLKNSYAYGSWGETRSLSVTIPNTFMFAGREGAEDGLSQYRMRYYDAYLGRFISEDPLGLAAGDASFYRYVYGDPTDIVDPFGLAGLEDLPDSVLDILADTPEGVTDILDDIGNIAAGMGDNLSMGLTGRIRDALGDSAVVDKCGGLYEAGEWAGTGVGLAMGGAHLGRNAVAQMGKRGNLLQRLGRGMGRLVWDDRRWGTTQRMWSNATGGQLQKGIDLHHWLIPQKAGWAPQGLVNAGLNYLPMSARLNRWMNGSTRMRRAVELGLRGTIGSTEGSPLTALLGSGCDCE